jgi:adenosylcobinamide-GDP ribazoletransferase
MSTFILHKIWIPFWTAWMFLTKIPAPKIPWSPKILQESVNFFPVVGCILGTLVGGFFYISSALWPASICALLSLSLMVWLTHGFHYDGLADSADGYGGGYNKSKIIVILKDSRIGTYGSLALILTLALQANCLSQMQPMQALKSWILVASLARITPLLVMYFHSYGGDEEHSKAKPLAQNIRFVNILFALIFALFLSITLLNPFQWICALISLGFVYLYIHFLAQKTQGYTGDLLGASEQISETVLFLILIIPQLQ